MPVVADSAVEAVLDRRERAGALGRGRGAGPSLRARRRDRARARTRPLGDRAPGGPRRERLVAASAAASVLQPRPRRCAPRGRRGARPRRGREPLLHPPRRDRRGDAVLAEWDAPTQRRSATRLRGCPRSTSRCASGAPSASPTSRPRPRFTTRRARRRRPAPPARHARRPCHPDRRLRPDHRRHRAAPACAGSWADEEVGTRGGGRARSRPRHPHGPPARAGPAPRRAAGGPARGRRRPRPESCASSRARPPRPRAREAPARRRRRPLHRRSGARSGCAASPSTAWAPR